MANRETKKVGQTPYCKPMVQPVETKSPKGGVVLREEA